MLGLEFDFEVAPLREKLIYEYHIFTGGAKDKYILRILPSLGVSQNELQKFFIALKAALS